MDHKARNGLKIATDTAKCQKEYECYLGVRTIGNILYVLLPRRAVPFSSVNCSLDSLSHFLTDKRQLCIFQAWNGHRPFIPTPGNLRGCLFKHAWNTSRSYCLQSAPADKSNFPIKTNETGEKWGILSFPKESELSTSPNKLSTLVWRRVKQPQSH